LRIRIEKEMDFRVCVGTSKNAISTAFSECRFVAAKGLAAFYEKYKLCAEIELAIQTLQPLRSGLLLP
jgi:hypothetical protein